MKNIGAKSVDVLLCHAIKKTQRVAKMMRQQNDFFAPIIQRKIEAKLPE
jgi:hypothetical protein